MLPHYLSSDDKIPPYAGKSLDSIVLANFLVTINRFGQSAGIQTFPKRELHPLGKQTLRGSSETKRGLSEQWLNWLTGLIEADGFFPNEKDKTLSFYISQSTKNAPLIYALKYWLGFGKVRWQHSEKMVHFVIEDIPNLTILANLINGRLRTEFKYEAYVKWINRFNKKAFVKNKVIVEPLNPNIDLNWLAGFTEGNGSFFIGLGNSPKSKLGVQVTLNISWTQKHRKTLELFASQFKGIWSYNKTQKCWEYNIKRKSELKHLLFSVFADNPLYGIKKYDYFDLKRACELFNTKQHLTESGLKLLLEIKSNMNSRRTSASIKSPNY
uniref:Homing endonuclease LAGLIDADG domain-containing protein n=2 Tax=Rhizophagus TaxID=1129544 RepID=A0A140F297_9GLOM|nr:LAGLIDADG orf [Rhizophagus intraradices]ACM45001.1 LAGLIDADG orf [Rhizophagus intraradices]AML60487.1 hypothetical protein [Rhizophagus irregularis]AML60531.1 hypothetical protein [Rhizophagus irregularis]AML60538.1 hypothetical protein [Rhizophagus irregularis]